MRHQNERALLRRAMKDGEPGVIVFTREGRVQLATGRSRQWLEEYFGTPLWLTNHLPTTLRYWIKREKALLGRDDGARRPREPLLVEQEGKRLLVWLLSDPDQNLLLLVEQSMTRQPTSLERFGLTRRETEVLRSVAVGGTNTEVAQLLGLSPRTVQKHLEHIYGKLGVETRTAAAVRVHQAVTGTSDGGS